MALGISQARTDAEGLDQLEPLWSELHRHHVEVSDYRALVSDVSASWQARRAYYLRLLEQGGCYLVAVDDGRPVGYAMISLEPGLDDTFEVSGGIAEVVTLVVAGGHRSAGAGDALLRAAESVARDRGIDTVRIAVMSGNAGAQRFYEAHGYEVAELLLYRRLDS